MDFFEYWSKLAASDPERFERERREAIEEVISRASVENQEQLRRLQWHIDTVRARASNPLAAHVALSRMFWEHFYAERGFLNALTSFSNGNLAFFERYRLPPSPEKTQVLLFHKK